MLKIMGFPVLPGRFYSAAGLNPAGNMEVKGLEPLTPRMQI